MIGDNAKRGLKENKKNNTTFAHATINLNEEPIPDNQFPGINPDLCFTRFDFFVKKK